MVSLRQMLVQGIAILSILLATACGTPAVSPPTAVPPPTNAPAVPTSVPAPPDTLRWSLDGITKLPSLDPARPGGTQSTLLIGLIFSGLIRLDERLEIQPDAAAEWSVSADGTRYTFTLREGLAFADGTPVTADDFVYSINRALMPETASFGAPSHLNQIVGAQDVIEGREKNARGVLAIDERTLEIALDRPLAYFLAQLSYSYTFVVPRTLVESGDDWHARAYGSGPYQIASVNADQSVVLVANERYWGGMPGIAKIEMPLIGEAAESYRRYRAGELDVMGNRDNPVPAAKISEVQGLADFRSAAALTTRYIGFNNRRAPFDQMGVRRALALAVDKQGAADNLLGGAVLPADRILPSGMLGTQFPIRPLRFDPAAARQELANAGFPDGEGFPPITLSYAREGDNEIIVGELKRVWESELNITVNLEGLELGAFISGLDRTYFTPDDGFDLYLGVWGADYPDPHNFLTLQLRTGLRNNNGHFSDTAFDRLVDEADRLSNRAEIERRLQLYNQAEQIAIDQVGWLPLFYPRYNILLSPRVEGLVLTPTGIVAPDWTQVRLADS